MSSTICNIIWLNDVYHDSESCQFAGDLCKLNIENYLFCLIDQVIACDQ